MYEVKYIGDQTLIYMCIVVYYMYCILYLIKYAKRYFYSFFGVSEWNINVLNRLIFFGESYCYYFTSSLNDLPLKI